jgi:hypothetical protein
MRKMRGMRPRRALRVGTPGPALPVDGLLERRPKRPKGRKVACRYAPDKVRVRLIFFEAEWEVRKRLCS